MGPCLGRRFAELCPSGASSGRSWAELSAAPSYPRLKRTCQQVLSRRISTAIAGYTTTSTVMNSAYDKRETSCEPPCAGSQEPRESDAHRTCENLIRRVATDYYRRVPGRNPPQIGFGQKVPPNGLRTALRFASLCSDAGSVLYSFPRSGPPATRLRKLWSNGRSAFANSPKNGGRLGAKIVPSINWRLSGNFLAGRFLSWSTHCLRIMIYAWR
jgi:hypothetical protein